MKKLLIVLMLCLSIRTVKSQTAEDALRYSQYGIFGTAAYIGRGGAIGALGGDLTAASYNPAGLGTYQRSEFILSPGLNITNSSSKYFHNTENDFRLSFTWAPMGVLFAVPTTNTGNWKVIQAAININRLASFSNSAEIEGTNPHSSLTDAWVSKANRSGYLDPFTSKLAFETYLIDLDDNNVYFPDIPTLGSEQYRFFREKGGIDELTFSLSGNYNDFLYLGATIGVPMISYDYTSEYIESHYYAPNTLKETFKFTEDLYTDGVGINLKIGAIVRPLDWLRVGAAFHSPTFYSLHDSYKTSLDDFIANQYIESINGEGDYFLTTPFKAIGSIGAVLGDQNSIIAGSLGIDYEYSDYSFMNYLGGESQWRNAENKLISSAFTAGHVLRAGGALNIRKAIVRAGYVFLGSPYEKSYANQKNGNAFTFGLGYKTRSWYVDFAYAYTIQKGDYYMYDSSLSIEPASITRNSNLFMTTFGFRFGN